MRRLISNIRREGAMCKNMKELLNYSMEGFYLNTRNRFAVEQVRPGADAPAALSRNAFGSMRNGVILPFILILSACCIVFP